MYDLSWAFSGRKEVGLCILGGKSQDDNVLLGMAWLNAHFHEVVLANVGVVNRTILDYHSTDHV